MSNELEIKRCLVCSTAHMTFDDNTVLGMYGCRITPQVNWVLEYEYGFIIDLWGGRVAVLRLKRIGISKILRKFVYQMMIKHDIKRECS
ncbi:DUF5983 family protein [Yersinia enterocolitica]|uniref:DUF5983 family protein n=1 Tax=Yersinia enterocolitica TaxID=630 RepID=UPI003D7B99B5